MGDDVALGVAGEFTDIHNIMKINNETKEPPMANVDPDPRIMCK